MFKGFKNAMDYVVSRMTKNRLVVFVQLESDLEQRNLGLGGTKGFDLFSCVVDILNVATIHHSARNGQE